MTQSMNRACEETKRRREIQIAYNKKHHITPKTITKNVRDITDQIKTEHQRTVEALAEMDKMIYTEDLGRLVKEKEQQMSEAVKKLDFETAAILRDEIKILLSKKPSLKQRAIR